jgi:hypothetical protein
MTNNTNGCACESCPGTGCTCGCQAAKTDKRSGCQCGSHCGCGSTCTCKKS